ncbi:putative mitotubule-associated protein Gb4 [Trypanosoma theileri]|uniref:Putative mitotubule-associated protein Gb4 n=1 Tax=Trypanosoma theileri TaxID=67003 RepID=A0A1X0P7P7_9TRYP|nr:putative mitotubule-associated protein Gb4 [Trypanosoma theileri]ORC92861.1 putative mitotubule-associated protein Gb4 [Trypanosoma theileri]
MPHNIFANPKLVWHPMPEEVRQRVKSLRWTNSRDAKAAAAAADRKKTRMTGTASVQNSRGAFNSVESTHHPSHGQQSVYRGRSNQSESAQQIGFVFPPKHDSGIDSASEAGRFENQKSLLSHQMLNRTPSERSNFDPSFKSKMSEQKDFPDHRSVAESQLYPASFMNNDSNNNGGSLYGSCRKTNISWSKINDNSFCLQRGLTEESSEIMKTKHTIRFRGLKWKRILKRKRSVLEEALKKDISAATGFNEKEIFCLDIEFKVALIVTFVLQHKSDTESKEIHTLLHRYDYVNTTALYTAKN